MRISDWSSDVCSSDLDRREARSRSSRSAAQQVFSLNKFTPLIRDEIRAGVAPDDILAAMADSTVHLITTVSELFDLPPSPVTHFFKPRPHQHLSKSIPTHCRTNHPTRPRTPSPPP